MLNPPLSSDPLSQNPGSTPSLYIMVFIDISQLLEPTSVLDLAYHSCSYTLKVRLIVTMLAIIIHTELGKVCNIWYTYMYVRGYTITDKLILLNA